MRSITITICTIFALSGGAAANDSDCDCQKQMGSCTANVSLQGNWLKFTATTRQCAMITYSVNGNPSEITIKGGKGEIDYLRTSTSIPATSVDSCTICATSNQSTAVDRDALLKFLSNAEDVLSKKAQSDSDFESAHKAREQADAVVNRKLRRAESRRWAKIRADAVRAAEADRRRREAAAASSANRSANSAAAFGAFMSGFVGGLSSGIATYNSGGYSHSNPTGNGGSVQYGRGPTGGTSAPCHGCAVR
jgi:hypothetical protein